MISIFNVAKSILMNFSWLVSNWSTQYSMLTLTKKIWTSCFRTRKISQCYKFIQLKGLLNLDVVNCFTPLKQNSNSWFLSLLLIVRHAHGLSTCIVLGKIIGSNVIRRKATIHLYAFCPCINILSAFFSNLPLKLRKNGNYTKKKSNK